MSEELGVYSRLLVLLDGSGTAEIALSHVPSMVQCTEADHVTLLRVLEQPSENTHGAETSEYLLEHSQGLTEELAEALGQPPEVASATVPAVDGDVPAAVFDFVSSDGSGLMMLATRGWAGADWWTRGSVAERLVKEASVPVHVVRTSPGRSRGPGAITKVLVPLDGSPYGEAAIASASELARVADATVHLLYVEGDAGSESDMRDQLSEVATRMDGDGISVVTAVQQGRPGQRIALTADEESFDLVVMSSRGLAGAGRGAFGGVSEAVIHGCSVPVLVVPPAAAEAG